MSWPNAPTRVLGHEPPIVGIEGPCDMYVFHQAFGIPAVLVGRAQAVIRMAPTNIWTSIPRWPRRKPCSASSAAGVSRRLKRSGRRYCARQAAHSRPPTLARSPTENSRMKRQRRRANHGRLATQRGRPQHQILEIQQLGIGKLRGDPRPHQRPGFRHRAVEDHRVGIQSPHHIRDPDAQDSGRFRGALRSPRCRRSWRAGRSAARAP